MNIKPAWPHRVMKIKKGMLLSMLLEDSKRNELAHGLAEYMFPLLMGGTTTFSDAKKVVRWWDATVGVRPSRMTLRAALHELMQTWMQNEATMMLVSRLAVLLGEDAPKPKVPGMPEPPKPNAPSSHARH
jgi:hypothetical protein